MAPLEELQQLWQQQSDLPPAHSADISRLLRAYGRRQSGIAIAKAVILGSVLAWAFAHVGSSLPGIVGLTLVALIAGFLMLDQWRTQRALARRDFAAPSAGFVRDTIDRLTALRNCRRSYAVVFCGILIGVNAAMPGGLTLRRFLTTLSPLPAFELGLFIRRKRWDSECGPLVARLRAAEAALEDRAR
jgi:hypothetical protein